METDQTFQNASKPCMVPGSEELIERNGRSKGGTDVAQGSRREAGKQ